MMLTLRTRGSAPHSDWKMCQRSTAMQIESPYHTIQEIGLSAGDPSRLVKNPALTPQITHASVTLT